MNSVAWSLGEKVPFINYKKYVITYMILILSVVVLARVTLIVPVSLGGSPTIIVTLVIARRS